VQTSDQEADLICKRITASFMQIIYCYLNNAKGDFMLNNEQFQGKWTEIKSGLKNLWGEITDDEIESVKDNLQSIDRIVQKKYGERKESIFKKLEALMESFENETDKSLKFNDGESSYRRSPLIPRDENGNPASI
jgi:uncharacterized protein YjbJ (UPF0337 family)